MSASKLRPMLRAPLVPLVLFSETAPNPVAMAASAFTRCSIRASIGVLAHSDLLQLRVVSKEPKKSGGCCLWRAQATVQMCVAPPAAAETAHASICTRSLSNSHKPFTRVTLVCRYTSAGLVHSWRVPEAAADAPSAFAHETWKVAEITLGAPPHLPPIPTSSIGH